MKDSTGPAQDSLPAAKSGLSRGLNPGLSRRQLIAGGIGLVGLSASATGAYAGAVEPTDLLVTPYTLTPPNWPMGQKLTITVIADLHAGGPHITLPQIARIVDTANALRSDLVVLLGDYKAHYKLPLEPIEDALWGTELERLRAPLGVWAILGNHDWWFDARGVRKALVDARIPLLENDAVLLGAPGRKFWLAGIGDQLAHWIGPGRFRGADDLPGTLEQIRTDDPVVLLVHEPDIFPRVPERVSLTLAGHTHGGQIRIPLIWPQFVPSRYGARFAYGHIIEDNRHMIVSGGLGTSTIPARLGVPPEILHVTLGV
jgi:predicted MPP superfamily phosphohydrolase